MLIVCKWMFLTLMLLSFQQAKAQNIVPNGQLEDVNICTEFRAPCSPSAWFAVKQFIPGGYYHQYPDKAASGKQYFDLFVVVNGASRQYWQTRLLCRLLQGQKYHASVKIAAGETGPNVNDIGFYFTSSFIYSQSDTLLQPPVYLNFLDADVKKLNHNWFQLTKEFIAPAGASCLIIGNFSREDNRSILRRRRQGNIISLMIDDIVIMAINGQACGDLKQRKDSLYAIRIRHSGDTLYRKNSMATDTVSIKIVPAAPKKVDTLQLSNVLFDFDRYNLIHPDTIEAFRQVLTNPSVKRIQVVGYTDDAGSVAYNARLSEKRAEAIAEMIAERFKIPATIMEATGKGISTFYKDKSKNRRVDIYVFY